MNNTDDPVTNGCLLLGATVGNSGAWDSAELQMGPSGLTALQCHLAFVSLRLRIAAGDVVTVALFLAELADGLPGYRDNHLEPIRAEERFGGWVQRAVVNEFYNDDAEPVTCSGWPTREEDDVTQGTVSGSDTPGLVCALSVSVDRPFTIRWHTLRSIFKGSAEVHIDGVEDCSNGCPVDLGSLTVESRLRLDYPVDAGTHIMTITILDTCRIIDFPRGPVRIPCPIGDVDVDGFEIDLTGL